MAGQQCGGRKPPGAAVERNPSNHGTRPGNRNGNALGFVPRGDHAGDRVVNGVGGLHGKSGRGCVAQAHARAVSFRQIPQCVFQPGAANGRRFQCAAELAQMLHHAFQRFPHFLGLPREEMTRAVDDDDDEFELEEELEEEYYEDE